MDIDGIFEPYLRRFPADGPKLQLLQRQISTGDRLCGRTNFTGHVTTGAIVISPDHLKVLLVHHRFLGKWLQPLLD